MNRSLKSFLIVVGLLISLLVIFVFNEIRQINKLNDYFYAIYTNDLKTIQKLIDQGIDVNVRSPKTASSALEIAISDNNLALTELLLKNKALQINLDGTPLIDSVPQDSDIYKVLKNAETHQQEK